MNSKNIVPKSSQKNIQKVTKPVAKTTPLNPKISQNSNPNEVDENFLRAFYPTPEKGMKWVYTMTINIQGMTLNGEMIMEVYDIVDEKVKLRITMGDQKLEEETSIKTFAPVPNAGGSQQNTGYVYDLRENLNLPYGEVKNTARLSGSSKDGPVSLWLAEGLGPVKFGINSGGIPADLELREFVKL